MSGQDLIQEAFGALNSFKRHRALAEIKKMDKQYHELQMFKMFDKIELSLRAIQKAARQGELDLAEEESDDEETHA